MQTTFHRDPNGDTWTSNSLCPVFPSHMTKLTTDDGTMYFQLRDRVVRLDTDGNACTWYNKPQLKQLVKAKSTGACYQYFADGSAVYSYMENPKNPSTKISMKWSAPAPANLLNGSPLLGYFDPVRMTYAEPIPCRMCSDNCEGGDYEDWRFCSRACMVECSRTD